MFKTFDLSRSVTVKTDALNYIAVKILLQLSNTEILHSVFFFSYKIILKKCNYEIYNKKLLVIIKTFKKWKLKTYSILKSVTVLINYKNLEHFIIIWKLNYH